MVLHLHRAPRTDLLADALGELLSTPLSDPFTPEVVVVPVKGMERWLSQRLSHVLGATAGDGVCAGVEFRRPLSLVAEVLGTRDEDPWSAEALVWPLLSVLDASLGEPWARTLAQHLGHGHTGDEAALRRGRRFAVARRLARLFASYAVQRPGVLADWQDGRDTDGHGRAVPTDLDWQPELWRRLAAQVGAPTPHARHVATLARLREAPAGFDLPDRLSLFGHTRLPTTEVALLGALGEHRDVHLWLPHPSRALWDRLAGTTSAGPVPRADDVTHLEVGHPLLATLGRDVRELQRTLATVDVGDEPVGADPDTPDTLLGWLQSDLRADRMGDPSARVLRRGDRTLQVHACHGAARQVDVLREVILGLLADDPTLEPRDVLVMCPDIETFAPLIQAGFGLGDVVGADGHPAHRLRVSLADRALTQTNPVLGVLGRLVVLADGRAGAAEVLDLAHAEPVRRRFGFSDDDLQQLADWVRAAGVRWAFDAEHRAPYGLSDYVGNTWQFGLDRLLSGVAMSDDSGVWLDTTLPLDDVGSGQVELAGRFAEYVARLRAVTDALSGHHPVEEWLALIADGLGALTAVSSTDSWQTGQVQWELGRLRQAAGALGRTDLRLTDVRSMLDDALGGQPTRANFRTGTLTVCTMVPMRSVPHRVVCLLGLDDGVFPRVGIADGDDLLARDPLTGERDLRSEDRQLMLDAVLAATETLVITYDGANEYSGQRRPPAVPLGELLDTLDLTARAEGRVSERVTVHHPLQPFDGRNLDPGALVPDQPFSFDRAAAAGATAAAGPRQPALAFLPEPLSTPTADGPGTDVVSLDDLLAFYRNPVLGFLRQRLDVALALDDKPIESGLPVEIDNLQQWSVGDRVLLDLLAGVDKEVAKNREWRRGVLPPGWLGWRILQQVADQAEPISDEGRRLRTRDAHAVDVDVDLGDGRRLVGTVPEVYGDRLVAVGYSRLGATHRLQSWLRLLALTAHDGDRAWTAYTIGRPTNSRSGAPFSQSLLGPLDHLAADVLRDLVRIRDHGLCEPLPLPLKSSLTYARQRRTDATRAEALRKVGWDWEDGRFPGEQSDAAAVKIWGPKPPLPGDDVPPPDGETHPGETTRFGALALRVWSPLLDAEQGSW